MTGFVSPRVGELVLGGADVATSPVESNGIGLVKFVGEFDERKVFDGARFFLPVVTGPSGRPGFEDIDPKLRVGVDVARFGASIFHGGNESATFHADVGRRMLASKTNGLTVFEDSVTARARIGGSRAVRPEGFCHGIMIA